MYVKKKHRGIKHIFLAALMKCDLIRSFISFVDIGVVVVVVVVGRRILRRMLLMLRWTSRRSMMDFAPHNHVSATRRRPDLTGRRRRHWSSPSIHYIHIRVIRVSSTSSASTSALASSTSTSHATATATGPVVMMVVVVMMVAAFASVLPSVMVAVLLLLLMMIVISAAAVAGRQAVSQSAVNRDEDLSGPRPISMLAEPHALPRAQVQLAVGHRHGQVGAEEAGFDVSGLKCKSVKDVITSVMCCGSNLNGKI